MNPFLPRLYARIPFCVFIMTILTCTSSLVAEDPPKVRNLAKVLKPIMSSSQSPAVAAAVFRDGKLIAQGFCGVRSIESKEPVTADDIWPIGSCSKPIARLVLARLMEKGLVKPDATLGDLLKGMEIREEYRDVTLADLVSHKAGIQPYTQIGPKRTPILFELKGKSRDQRAKFTAHVLNEQPAVPPKQQFLYSNAGFCVLATALENVADKPWEKLVKEEIFIPLELQSATEGGKNVKLYGHMHAPDGIVAARPYPRLAAMIPAGGVSLTIADFAAFASAETDVEAGRPVLELSEETLKRMPDLRSADSPTNQPGSMLFGGDGHYTAAFAVWPKERVAIAVACNIGDGDGICTQLASAVRAEVAPELPPGETGRSGMGGPRGRMGGAGH